MENRSSRFFQRSCSRCAGRVQAEECGSVYRATLGRMRADSQRPERLGASGDKGVNLWIGYGAIYVKGGQQTRGNAGGQRARASFVGGGDSGASVESRARW